MNAIIKRASTVAAALLIVFCGCSARHHAKTSGQPRDSLSGGVAYGAELADNYTPQLAEFAEPNLPDPAAWPVAGAGDGYAQGVEPLTRGPVHEAFAEPTAATPQGGQIVTRQPPPAIPEVPPDEKPQGDNVLWIPGYWGWDADQQDFIWVSGVWRVVPPGTRWTPGYWAAVEGGFAWVPGFWASVADAAIQYLPTPPDLVEDEQTGPPPAEDSTWAPGFWEYGAGRYVWRHGVWIAGQPDWIWTPPHYVWTPRGYIFVRGYWDYPLGRRGILFAPVAIGPSTYGQPGFVYCPDAVIDPDFLDVNLFVGPGCGGYYFGDYYDPGYFASGFCPVVIYHSRRGCYDPIFAHDRWSHRHDDRWDEHRRRNYEQLRDHRDGRPPRTFAAQLDQLRRGPVSGLRSGPVVRPMRDLTSGRAADNSLRLEKINSVARDKFLKQSRDLSQVRAGRVRQDLGAARSPVAPAPTRLSGTKLQTGSRPATDTRGGKGLSGTNPIRGLAAPELTKGARTIPESNRGGDTHSFIAPRAIPQPTITPGPKLMPKSTPTIDASPKPGSADANPASRIGTWARPPSKTLAPAMSDGTGDVKRPASSNAGTRIVGPFNWSATGRPSLPSGGAVESAKSATPKDLPVRTPSAPPGVLRSNPASDPPAARSVLRSPPPVESPKLVIPNRTAEPPARSIGRSPATESAARPTFVPRAPERSSPPAAAPALRPDRSASVRSAPSDRSDSSARSRNDSPDRSSRSDDSGSRRH